MIQWGITAMSHDATIAVIENGADILFAAHSERYSRIKNDPNLNDSIISAALEYGYPDQIVWYEKPHKKRLRQLVAGQYSLALTKQTVSNYLFKTFGNLLSTKVPIKYIDHHESHAAAGFYTSPFAKYEDAAVIVVDSIGEFDTISIWHANGDELSKIFSSKYPDSVGLFYSAMTERCGLKPNEEEYIMMGMAAYGTPCIDMHQYIDIDTCRPEFRSKINFHRGVTEDFAKGVHPYDIAASAQKFLEQYLKRLVQWAAIYVKSSNLVLMGGVALNCVANEEIARYSSFSGSFKNIWIMPNPGDGGSAIGAVAAYNRQPINWKTPYLGTNIVRPFQTAEMTEALGFGQIIGLANGRAEFGPRALGNRSLLADPRGSFIKERVNDIKHREQFRPFAPIIMEEFASQYFDMAVPSSPYMQYTAQVLRPDLYPAITHIDNTARVQTVNAQQHPKMYELLTQFYKATGCPMLLNTSLNIKGEPLVDTWSDALRFEKVNKVKVF